MKKLAVAKEIKRRGYIEAYKAFKVENSTLKFMFKAHEGTRIVPINRWLKAKQKVVSDGTGRQYRAGFHCFLDIEAVHRFVKQTKGKYLIVIVKVKGVRPKPNSTAKAWLAKELLIPHHQEIVYFY